MSTTYTINVYDLPITLTKKSGTTIKVDDQTRSTISTDSNNKYGISKISICEPLDTEQHTFDIIFQYDIDIISQYSGTNNGNSKLVYIQVPVILENVSSEFINTECTEFIESVNSTADSKSFWVNLSELFGTLTKDVDPTNNPKTYSSTNSNIVVVIQYNAIYLNITKPATSFIHPLGSLTPTSDSVKLNSKPAPRNFRKTGDYNPESRDPTRTMPIEIYIGNNKEIKNEDNPDNIKDEIKTTLSTYTNLMISFIVVVFIIATLYVIWILIPDSKLRIIKPTNPIYPARGGGLRQTWNTVYKKIAHIFR
jgi:hypothetical protein